jgi:hypothetical protein
MEESRRGDRTEAARARVRAAGFDPASVPHAGAQALEGYRLWVGELEALGLQGEALLAALAGPSVVVNGELDAVNDRADT